jgi:hypothetical protein
MPNNVVKIGNFLMANTYDGISQVLNDCTVHIRNGSLFRVDVCSDDSVEATIEVINKVHQRDQPLDKVDMEKKVW